MKTSFMNNRLNRIAVLFGTVGLLSSIFFRSTSASAIMASTSLSRDLSVKTSSQSLGGASGSVEPVATGTQGMADGTPLSSDLSRGVMLGLMMGDALGMPFEGLSAQDIASLRISHLLEEDDSLDYTEGLPMGTFMLPRNCSGFKVDDYVEAKAVGDHANVPCGPVEHFRRRGSGRSRETAMEEAMVSACSRRGTYTDDANSCLAVAFSLVNFRGEVDAQDVAETVARFFRDNELYRGCPPTAKTVQDSILRGIPIDETGLPPIFPFEGGSFANGGGMRISPVAISYLHAEPDVLRSAVEKVCWATHRHPEAIDFAMIQAWSVQYALRLKTTGNQQFLPQKFFEGLAALGEYGAVTVGEITKMVRSVEEKVLLVPPLLAISEGGKGLPPMDEENRMHRQSAEGEFSEDLVQADTRVLRELCEQFPRPGSGADFQIASIHMAATVLFIVGRYLALSPTFAIRQAVRIGGDTDTTASMVGAIAIAGAYWGESHPHTSHTSQYCNPTHPTPIRTGHNDHSYTTRRTHIKFEDTCKNTKLGFLIQSLI